MRNRDWKNRMREFRSCGSVGEPMGNHRLYPAETKGDGVNFSGAPLANRFASVLRYLCYLLFKIQEGRDSIGGRVTGCGPARSRGRNSVNHGSGGAAKAQSRPRHEKAKYPA